MAESTIRALHERGVEEPAASLAAHSAVTAFQVAFARWISDDQPGFADCVADAAVLRALE